MVIAENTAPRFLEFMADDSTGTAALEACCVAAGLKVASGDHFCGAIRFFDTFDWRIYLQGQELSRIGNHYRLCRRDSGETLVTFPWRRKNNLAFSSDLCNPEIQQLFAGLIDNRALIEHATAHLETQTMEISDGDSKTLVLLTLQNITIKRHDHHAPCLRVVKIEQKKGGRREFRHIAEIIRTGGGLVPAATQSPLAVVTAALSIVPGTYSTRIVTALTPTMGSREAVVMLARDIFRIMRLNEPGLLADIDTEFLHDFRVSIRRLRSLLSQLGKVFPVKHLDQFKSEFAILGRLTNHLRDCDVLLENRHNYEAMLPPSLTRGLLPFFNNIAAARRKEHHRLVEYLRAGHYHHLCQEWENFLNQAMAMSDTESSTVPINALAGKLILKRFRRILRRGASITRDSHDEELHMLRIACKKLRYLLEFFAPLHEDRLSGFIDMMKKMQSNLGDFNDLAVQIEKLDTRIRRTSPHHRNSLLTAAAVGGLIAILSEQKYRLRSEFNEVFSVFSSGNNMRDFEEKFAAKK